MTQADAKPATTPAQTVGPYLHLGLSWPDGPLVVPEDDPQGVWIHGTLYDGARHPITDGLVETWQADPEGRFDHPDDPHGALSRAGFRGFGRCCTDAQGRYAIRTLVPGAVRGPQATMQAPHIDVSVFARGLLHRLVTRIYFSDQIAANTRDPVLTSIGDPAARATLIADADSYGYRFDIRVQGPDETVFFDV
ncbi:protocatechuate 3,4-dioxygenase subunit alpha [Lipingzhangella sp. LS1_29]|uniref:Protocatechuate 3,4-dioxygenase subunit alpha n=1 Tax=Lipingzhangella rawalii TaxID=2055835 RepID=A0ABU2H7E7_9ACTN|nr:protocatechuate 3,4-dioxygenase subunit alpha [Lipingzhangella rawalii]MDS1271242.1 protocatechuate 3,4-dioxygenase subunit alpha [Lipingzhangella rawalii]